MIKFEDLKIGDIITEEGWDFNYACRVVALGPDYVTYVDDNNELSCKKKNQWVTEEWSYYTPPKQKKVKLMSPALITVKIRDFAYCIGTTYDILSGIYLGGLFEDEAEAKKFHGTAFKSWPAKDANGNPIQISVEVEE